jgi:hypothetical protein
MKWTAYVARKEKKRNAYGVWCENQKKPLGRPRCRWEDNIRIVLKKIGWGGMDWIHLAQDEDQWRAPVNTVMNLRVP